MFNITKDSKSKIIKVFLNNIPSKECQVYIKSLFKSEYNIDVDFSLNVEIILDNIDEKFNSFVMGIYNFYKENTRQWSKINTLFNKILKDERLIIIGGSFFRYGYFAYISLEEKIIDGKKISNVKKTLINPKKERDRNLLQNEIDILNKINNEFEKINIQNINKGKELIKPFAVKINSIEQEVAYSMDAYFGDLDDLIKQETIKDIDIFEKNSYINTIMENLIILHSINILHRDLHPGNILYKHNEKDLQLVFCDFGFSRDLDNIERVNKCYNYGNNEFIAPEQERKITNGSFASEQYSIGKLINYIMTGEAKNYNHKYGGVTSIATKKNVEDRYISLQEFKKQILDIM